MKKNKPTVPGSKSPIAGIIARYYPLILIGIVGAIIYSNSFDCSFHLDDFRYIVTNLNIRDIGDIYAIWNAGLLDRFVTYYAFALNYHFNQLDVFGYHLANLVIHIGSSLLVWWLVMLILSTPVMHGHPLARKKRFIALACALLFVSHPIQTQAVTYIYQRLASLATFFYLASLCFYLKARLTEKMHHSLVYFLFSVVMVILGLFTKETVVTLPLAVLLFEFGLISDWKDFFRKNRKILRYLIIPLVVALLYAILISHNIFAAFRTKVSPMPQDPPLTFWIYWMTQFRVILTYIRLLFIPLNQNLDYAFPASRSFFEPHTFFSFLMLVAILIAAIRLFPKKRIVSLGILWFFLTLSVESIIPLRDVIFEHRLYLPMFGFSLFFVSILYNLLGKNHFRIMTGILVVVISWFSFLTYQRNFVWKTEYTLWSDVIAKSPDKPRPLNNLGNDFYHRGDHDKAYAIYLKVLALNPTNQFVYNNIGTILFHDGKIDEARDAYQQAIALDSTNAEFHHNSGYVLSSQNHLEEAIGEYETAIGINPAYTDAYYNMGLALYEYGRIDEAIDTYRKAITLDPTYTRAYYNLGIIYYRQERFEEAVEELLRVVALQPDHVNAHTNLVICYQKLGREADARKHAGIAERLRGGALRQ